MSDTSKSMLNKICIVTGATSGIGKETAKALAYKGASVVIISRNAKKCKATVNKLKGLTGNTQIEYICADLSDLKQVRKCAKELKQKYEQIDVLVNNAGGYFTTRQESADGYEMNFALNYLSPFLLVSLLKSLLGKSEQGRIINVSSGAHVDGTIHFDNLQLKNQFNGYRAYANSKLALILFTNELAKKLKETDVTVNAMDPGLVATNFGKNNGLLRYYVRKFTKGRNDISAAEGAETTIYMASSPEVAKITGGYFIKNKQEKSSETSYDQDLANQLWQVTEDLVTV